MNDKEKANSLQESHKLIYAVDVVQKHMGKASKSDRGKKRKRIEGFSLRPHHPIHLLGVEQ